MIDYRNDNVCPKCGGNITSYRHIGSKRWCTICNFVVREEQEFTIPKQSNEVIYLKNECKKLAKGNEYKWEQLKTYIFKVISKKDDKIAELEEKLKEKR